MDKTEQLHWQQYIPLPSPASALISSVVYNPGIHLFISIQVVTSPTISSQVQTGLPV